MTDSSNPDAIGGVGSPFPSLAALQAAHRELLKRHRENGSAPALLAAIDTFIARGRATGVLLDNEDDRATAQSLLDYWATLLYRAGYEPPDATVAEFDPQLAPELDDSLCPYLGLDAFREVDSAIFFGRRRLVEFLTARLADRRLLALVGPSGSGKSSVVRAGLVPALKAGALPGSQTWRYFAPIVPGSDPLASLARLFIANGAPPSAPAAGTDAQVAGAPVIPSLTDLIASFRQDPQALARLVAAIGDRPALLVIDQFEEVFTLAEDEAAGQAFIASLIGLIEAPGARHTVILTLRSDFESFVARAPALQAWFEQTRVQLMPLNASEMREAIEKPAELVGLKFEAGVVDALLQDMLGEPAALPLLQFTLLKLWEHRQRNRVTWAAYQRIGGGRLALARSADEFYNGLIPEEQVTARRILLRMVRPGEGLEVTSSRVRRAALYQAGEARDRVDRVLEKLIAARLVRLTAGELPADDQVEVAHEALVRNWPTLVDWLEDERAAIAMRRRLEAKAAEWVRLGRGSSGLLDAAQLREAERWLAGADAAYLGYSEALPALEEASRQAIEAAEREQEAARQRELAQARALAEEQRLRAEAERRRAEEQARTSRRLQIFAIALAVMSLLAATGAAIAVGQRQAAQLAAARAATEADRALRAQATAQQAALVAQQAAEAERQARADAQQAAVRAETERAAAVIAQQTAEAARQDAERQRLSARAGQLAAQAQAALDQHPQLSLLLASEALKVTDQPLPVARETLQQILLKVDGRGLHGHRGPITALALSPDGRWLVTGSADATARVWDLTAANPAATAIELRGHGGPITALALSPDGRRLVTGSADATARVWDLTAANPAATAIELRGHGGPITALALSPNRQLLATGSDDATIRVWDLAAADPASAPRLLDRPGGSGRIGPIRALAFSPGRRWVLTGSDDGTARLWDLSRNDPVSPTYLARRSGPITAVAFSSNGGWFVTGGADRRVDLWRFSEQAGPVGNQETRLLGHQGPISALAFSSDNRWAISGSADGTARLWDLAAPNPAEVPIVLPGHSGEITALATSGRWLLTGSADGTARLWDLGADNPAAQSRVLGGHEGPVTAVAIAAGNGRIATGSADSTARLWDINTPAPADVNALPQDTAGLLQLACLTAGRNMTEAEWQQYFGDQPYTPTCGP